MMISWNSNQNWLRQLVWKYQSDIGIQNCNKFSQQQLCLVINRWLETLLVLFSHTFFPTTEQQAERPAVDFIASKLKRKIKLKRPTTVSRIPRRCYQIILNNARKSVMKKSTQRRAKHKKIEKKFHQPIFFHLSEKWCSERSFCAVFCAFLRHHWKMSDKTSSLGKTTTRRNLLAFCWC